VNDCVGDDEPEVFVITMTGVEVTQNNTVNAILKHELEFYCILEQYRFNIFILG